MLDIPSEIPKRGHSSITGVTLRSNGIKDMMKVNRSLENRGILLKGNTGKSISQDGELFSYLGTLMGVSLPLMKNVFMLLA